MITNPEQEEAIQSESKRLLVLAGAGSGKTKTLIDKIKHYLNKKKVNPKNILAITFTKDAINEIHDRLIEYSDRTGNYVKDLKVGPKHEVRRKYIDNSNVLKSLTIRTFHSLCYSILRDNGAGFFDNKFRVLMDRLDRDSDFSTDSFISKETVSTLIRKSVISACENDPKFLKHLEHYLIENRLGKKNAYRSAPHEFPKTFRTKGGHEVRSKSEQKIADWFYDRGYEIEYEPPADSITCSDLLQFQR